MGILDSLFGGGQSQQQQQPQAPQLPQLGLNDRLQAIYSPGLYAARQQAYQTQLQQTQQQAVFQALVDQGHSPAEAKMLALTPGLLSEMGKPQNVAPGGQLMSGLGLPGQGGGQAPEGGAVPGAQAPSPYQNRQGMADEDAINRAAEQGILGDTSWQKNAGMGALGQVYKQNVNNRISALAKERGISPAEMASRAAKFPAYQKSIEKLTEQQTAMGTGNTEFTMLWPQFEAAVKKYYANATGNGIMPTKFPTLNAIRMAASTQTGDPNAIAVGQLRNSLENTYVRAMSAKPGGATVDAHKSFRDVLENNWSPDQIKNAGVTLAKELQAARDSVPIEMNRRKVEFGLADPAPQDLIGQARDAVRRGAPQDKVRQRIIDQGFKPDGL